MQWTAQVTNVPFRDKVVSLLSWMTPGLASACSYQVDQGIDVEVEVKVEPWWRWRWR